MFNKKILMLAIFLISLLAVSAVSAEDNMTGDVAGVEIDDEVINLENDSSITQDRGAGTFDDLDSLIDSAEEDDTVKLNRDYKNTQNSSQLWIDKSLTIDGQGHTIDANHNSRVFYVDCDKASQVTLKNINFINAFSQGRGGGIYFWGESHVNIINCNFTNCLGDLGGGIYFNDNTTAQIIDCTFTDCSGEYGGGIYFWSQSTANIVNSKFTDCRGDYGGGIYFNYYATAYMTDCTVTGCSGENGGGIYFNDYAAAYITNCTFTGCSAEYGGGIYISPDSDSDISGSDFINCSGQFGAAVYLENRINSWIEDSNFMYNTADVLGGSILATNSYISMSRTSFTGSQAKYESGGAISLLECIFYGQYIDVTDCSSEFGGAITLLNSSTNITHSNFRRNSAIYDGGAIFAKYGLILLDDATFSDNSAARGGGIYVGLMYAEITGSQFTGNSAQKGEAVYDMTSLCEISGNTYGLNQNVYHGVNDNLTIYTDDYYQFKYSDTAVSQLPSYYSMIDEGLLTPVKDQGVEGNCWAFAAIATLESCILKASGLTLDLSEANMKNLMARYSDYGNVVQVNDGGHDEMAYGYLASWLGPVFEADDGYYANDYLSPLLKSIMHIQNVLLLKRESYTDNDGIKNAIMKYGAVSVSMLYNSTYLKNNVSYYYDGPASNNHAVCIVGWDDSYSRYNFKSTPSGNGAWIVRNSWGPSWGNDGYFYVSYYDTSFARVGKIDCFTFILNDTVKFNRVYQYEIENTNKPTLGSLACYKNVFTVEGDEYAAAVSTYFYDECDYNVKVYVNDELKAFKAGKTGIGYYTINLDNYIHLNKNDRVAVVFNCSNFAGGKGIIPVSNKKSNANLFLRENVSFYWTGSRWADNYPDGEVACIKLFTASLDNIKSDPYFEVRCEANVSDGSFIITVLLPNDATGTVVIENADGQRSIDISSIRSVRLYDLNDTNNVLNVSYSGDDKYCAKSVCYVVDIDMENKGTYEELLNRISNLNSGDVLDLNKDYYFKSGENINISRSVTIDGHGHAISGCNMSGIFAVRARNVVLKNIIFTDCLSERGAVLVAGYNCTLINCSFVNNHATEYGGAIFVSAYGCLVENCSFINNSADDYGGAICWLGGNGILSNSSFINNTVLNYNGGAIYLQGEYSEVSGCLFVHNNASYYGGAIDSQGINDAIKNCSFIDNCAYNGGAVSVFGNGTVVSNSCFTDNAADSYGGAVYLKSVGDIIENCSFARNSALVGGAVSVSGDEGNVVNCNFTDNGAYYYGGAIYMKGIGASVSDSRFINNSVFEFYNGGAVYCIGDSSGVFNCLFIDNYAVKYGGAIYLKANYTIIANSSFITNSAGYGGAILIMGGNENIILNCSFTDNNAINSYDAIYCDGADDILMNSTFINTLNANNIIWLNETGTIIGCRFYNKTTGNVNYKGDNFIKRDMDLKCNGTTFEHAYPETVVIWSDILRSLPTLNPLNVKLSKDGVTKRYTLYLEDGAVSLPNDINWDLGIWNLEVSASGDDNYYDSSAAFTISVTKVKSSLNLTAEVVIDHETSLTAVVLDSHNVAVNQGKVTFFDGETLIGSVNVVGGVAGMTYTPAASGEHTISAVYEGDGYLSSNDTCKVYIDSITVDVSADMGSVGYNTTFTANVIGLYSTVNDGFVSFYINGDYLGKVAVDNGVARYVYLPMAAGTHTVKAVYKGVEDTVMFTVNKAGSSLSIGDLNTTIGHELTLYANVTGSNGLIINDGKVTFFDGETNIGEARVVDGTASISYTPTAGGEHTILAVYDGDNYLSSNDTCKLLVDSVVVELSVEEGVVGFNSTFAADVRGLYSTVSGGSVRFYINGSYIGSADVDNGTASYTYVPLVADSFVVIAVYGYAEDYANFTVSKADSSLSIDDLNTTIGHELILSANVTSSNGLVVNDGRVAFFDGETNIGEARVVDGTASISYTPTVGGEHAITAVFDSDNYLSSNGTGKMLVDSVVVELSVEDGVVGYNATFAAEVRGLYSTVSGGSVRFYINGSYVGSADVDNGVARYVYLPQVAGSFVVIAVYGYAEDYAAFTVSKAGSSLSIGDLNSTVGHELTLSANVTSSNGLIINDGQVTFFDGITRIGEASVIGGAAGISYTPETDGEHTITAVYSGNNYLDSNDTCKLFIDSVNVELHVDAGVVGYNATFTADVRGLYSTVNGGYVSFYINGSYIGRAAVDNGAASYTYVPLAAGTFVVKAVYDYAEDSATFTVEKAASQLTISDAEGVVDKTLTLSAEVISSNGLIINDGWVNFLDGRTWIGEAKVIGGAASISYTPTAGGEHTITAVYSGNNYMYSNDTCKCLVDTFTVNVHVDGCVVGYNSTFVANVNGLYSTVNDGYVSFYVGNGFVGRAPVSGGVASFTYVPSTAGSTVLKAVYDGNERFSNAINYVVDKAASQVTIDDASGRVGNKFVLTARITSPNGLTIREGTVTFKDGSNVIGIASVSNGAASIEYTSYNAGSHFISAVFAGNNYLGSSYSKTVTVGKGNTKIVINDISNAYTNVPVTVSARVLSNGMAVGEGIVRFYVGGQEIYAQNVNGGYVSFDYTFENVGTFSILAEFGESENYLSSQNTCKVEVGKILTTLTSKDVSVAYNSGGYLTATLKDSNGNPLGGMDVVINKKTLRTDSNGQVKFSANGLAPKTYTMSITFAGEGKYAASSASAKIVVSKAASKLTASKKTFKAKLKTKKYAVTLKNNKGKAISKAKISLKIKGKTYKATTNAKGKATFKITKLTKKGKFSAVVKYGGNAYYKGVTKSVKITIK